jgi:hypothetical protein
MGKSMTEFEKIKKAYDKFLQKNAEEYKEYRNTQLQAQLQEISESLVKHRPFEEKKLQFENALKAKADEIQGIAQQLEKATRKHLYLHFILVTHTINFFSTTGSTREIPGSTSGSIKKAEVSKEVETVLKSRSVGMKTRYKWLIAAGVVFLLAALAIAIASLTILTSYPLNSISVVPLSVGSLNGVAQSNTTPVESQSIVVQDIQSLTDADLVSMGF